MLSPELKINFSAPPVACPSLIIVSGLLTGVLPKYFLVFLLSSTYVFSLSDLFSSRTLQRLYSQRNFNVWLCFTFLPMFGLSADLILLLHSSNLTLDSSTLKNHIRCPQIYLCIHKTSIKLVYAHRGLCCMDLVSFTFISDNILDLSF